MKSIRTKLIVFYAASATITVALLFIAGYVLLENRLTRGLDALNTAEFNALHVRLGSTGEKLSAREIEQRIRETTEAASVLFYINVDSPNSGMVFYSRNLKGLPIPDVKGRHVYTSTMPGIGKLRIGEFVTKPFDVTVATSFESVDKGLRSYAEVCAALLFAMLAASIAIGIALSRFILQPLVFIRETANRISPDNLSERIPESGVEDELSDLTSLLNKMFGRLETSFNQIRQFTADVSHELKTPLSLIRLHAEKILEDHTLPAEHVDAILVQLEELARLNQAIDELLFLSRAEANAITLDKQPLDPTAALERFVLDATILAEHRGNIFNFSQIGQGVVAFEERWLRQIWLNLLTNALHVSPRGGSIWFASLFVDGIWRITIEDEGPGLPDDQLKRVFERFKRHDTTKGTDTGSGLGLAICESIAKLHGGHIFASACKAKPGLCVTVELPCRSSTRPS